MSTAPLTESNAVIVTPYDGDGVDWDSFVSEDRASSFCHLAGWREVMADVLGHECVYLRASDAEGGWRAALPLVSVKSRLFGNYLVSMPFLNYGGPVGEAGAVDALVTAAVRIADDRGVDLLELRGRSAPPGALRTVEKKVTVLLDLPGAEKVLWSERFPSKLRSQVRRPLKEGMEARIGPGERKPFYRVFRRHMHELGTPVLPARFFEAISSIFRENVVFGAVYRDREPVAAGCGFVWRDEFELTWASSLRDYNRMAPNMLLYWSLMKEMIARGMRVFNFGRCTPGGGTHRFKKQWGGADVPLPWAQWSPSGVTSTPSPDRPVYRLAASAWQRLPRPVADRLGPILARRLP